MTSPTTIFIPRFSTLHLVAFAAMIYADDCQLHHDKQVANFSGKIRKKLKKYIDSLDSKLDRDVIDNTQIEIDDQLKNQFPKTLGDELKNMQLERMLIYCNATLNACEEIIKYQSMLYAHVVLPIKDLQDELNRLIKHLPDLSKYGRDLFDLVLKHNIEEMNMEPKPKTFDDYLNYYANKLKSIFGFRDVELALRSKTRKTEVIIIKHCLRWLLFRHFNKLTIGRNLGIDHTTVIHSINFFQTLLPIQNKALFLKIEKIEKPCEK